VAQLIDPAPTVERFHELSARPRRRHFALGLGGHLRWRLGCLVADVAMLALAGVATAIGATAAGVTSVSGAWTVGYCLLVLSLLAARGLYGATFGVRTFDDLRRIVGATTLAAISLLAVAALVGAGADTVDQSLRLWLYATAYLAAGRTALYWSQRQERIAGEGLRPTLIVGAGRVGRLTAQRLTQMPQLGLKPIGYLDKEPLADSGDGPLVPVLGASWDLERIVREHEVEQVIITFSTAPDDVLLRLVRRCEELGVAVAVVPRLYERTTTRLSVEHVGGLPLVSAHPSDPRGLHYVVKYAVDRLVSLALLFVLAPVLLGAAVATYLSVGRPILFRQRRIGRDGVEFDMLKFRTMRGSPDDRGELDARWAERQLGGRSLGVVASSANDDPRTRVGSFLRRSSLDELPQLLNVLRGHMSLVGPRPERTHYVRRFEGNVYRYGERHRVKSGITGWAQVNGLRGQTSLDDRVEWDNYYIENFSLWFDVKILLLTVAAVFKLTSD
jgi:exopolysaccharide biosynthesis polyprenyl glycosylphosphotransferase